MRIGSHFKRVLGFAALPALSAVSSLVLLPIIAHTQGAAGWTALVLGQSTGNVVSVIGGLAWFLVGGDRVARASESDRRSVFALSLVTRAVVLFPCVVGAGAVLLLLRPELPLASVLFMLGIAGNGFSASWYFAGTGEPGKLILTEGIPRVAGYVAAVPLVLTFGDVHLYAGVTVLAQVLSFYLNWRSVFRGHARQIRVPWSEVRHELRTQSTGTLARCVMSVSSSGGPPMIGALNPAGLAVFSALDGVSKAGINGTSFLPNAFVSWVRQGGTFESAKKRGRTAFLTVVVCSVIGVGVWQVAGGYIVAFLYAQKVDVTPTMILIVGLVVFGNLVCSSFELLVLIPQGMSRFVFRTQLCVSLVGLLGLIAASQFSIVMAFAVFAFTPLLRLAVYTIGRCRRRTDKLSFEGDQ